MVSYDELKEIDIKNHLPYYFNDIMRYWFWQYFIRQKMI